MVPFHEHDGRLTMEISCAVEWGECRMFRGDAGGTTHADFFFRLCFPGTCDFDLFNSLLKHRDGFECLVRHSCLCTGLWMFFCDGGELYVACAFVYPTPGISRFVSYSTLADLVTWFASEHSIFTGIYYTFQAVTVGSWRSLMLCMLLFCHCYESIWDEMVVKQEARGVAGAQTGTNWNRFHKKWEKKVKLSRISARPDRLLFSHSAPRLQQCLQALLFWRVMSVFS